ncbi:MAG: CRISPR-associated endonuclease Cas2 [Candidatus Vogelbacteria bacterium RIFOXYD1_FULL_51_18]|uniref:CRISPR-associated endoribonuclease Cas2 n=1 Tax=Candidatus Vogelbacteria bacterium RIFOXYD1_FULL_51_18 TaxID=1802440 RepID=A0A1G2QJM9_9BACT|nr:MAG: CRISPR-associated endonuclease Cas2 [Candidatus Vogelbacteria bacterium RIFOXYD1_FULL_51_18]
MKKKVLLLIFSGIALSLSRSPRGYFKIIGHLRREWKSVDHRYLLMIIREFKEHRLIDYRESEDGTISLVLTERGRERTLSFQLDTMEIPHPVRWDGLWRIVFFDIPEKFRERRDAFRNFLKQLGFIEIQKSVWVHPYPCKDQIDFAIEVFEVRVHARYGELATFTLEEELLARFHLKKPAGDIQKR